VQLWDNNLFLSLLTSPPLSPHFPSSLSSLPLLSLLSSHLFSYLQQKRIKMETERLKMESEMEKMKQEMEMIKNMLSKK
jgi:hypothetical protein